MAEMGISKDGYDEIMETRKGSSLLPPFGVILILMKTFEDETGDIAGQQYE